MAAELPAPGDPRPNLAEKNPRVAAPRPPFPTQATDLPRAWEGLVTCGLWVDLEPPVFLD
jgi:hypothetical protein